MKDVRTMPIWPFPPRVTSGKQTVGVPLDFKSVISPEIKHIVVVGRSTTGKTALARSIAKELDYRYLSFDERFDYSNPDLIAAQRELLSEVAAENIPSVIDGYIWREGHQMMFSEMLGNQSLLILPIQPRWMTLQKQMARFLAGKASLLQRIIRESDDGLEEDFFQFSKRNSSLKIVSTTDFEWKEVRADEAEAEVQRQSNLGEVRDYVEIQGKDEHYDALYQDIPEINLKGYSESAKSWDQISKLLNFQEKSICEIGPFHGYFFSRAVEAGATGGYGIERHKLAIGMARLLRDYHRLPIDYIQADAGEYSWPYPVDICLLLNVFHHVEGQSHLLEEIKKNSSTLVAEINLDDHPVIRRSLGKGWALIHEVESHRSKRVIVVYDKK